MKANRYFKTVPLLLSFEQMVVECNKAGRVILTKTDSGFIVDVYKTGSLQTTVEVIKEPEYAI